MARSLSAFASLAITAADAPMAVMCADLTASTGVTEHEWRISRIESSSGATDEWESFAAVI
jgi:hypothetical protein